LVLEPALVLRALALLLQPVAQVVQLPEEHLVVAFLDLLPVPDAI
jgi:hypothetical protein